MLSCLLHNWLCSGLSIHLFIKLFYHLFLFIFYLIRLSFLYYFSYLMSLIPVCLSCLFNNSFLYFVLAFCNWNRVDLNTEQKSMPFSGHSFSIGNGYGAAPPWTPWEQGFRNSNQFLKIQNCWFKVRCGMFHIHIRCTYFNFNIYTWHLITIDTDCVCVCVCVCVCCKCVCVFIC